MKNIRVHEEAARETDEALLWYAKWGDVLWQRLQDEVTDAVTSAASHPLLYGIYLHGTRRVLLKSFPYLVVYLYHQDEVVVIAVAHAKRDPGYWANRLPSKNPQ